MPTSVSDSTCDWTVYAVGPSGSEGVYILVGENPYEYDPQQVNVRAYLESNGIPGAQRGGTSLLFGDADPCVESETPDQYLF